MPDSESLLEDIQAQVRAKTYHYTLHAGDRMTQRHISVGDVEEAVRSDRTQVIEDYPDDPRGPSCLILGFTEIGRPHHVQFTYPPAVAVITAYDPDPDEWIDWRTRQGRPT